MLEDNTMTRITSALILTLAAAFCSAAEQPMQLADTAPDRYTVTPGDTLWGISAKFLKEPWRWPEIWRMNRDQIKDPHWIYPGEVIVLDRDANGNPLLRVQGRNTLLGAQDQKLAPRIHSTQLAVGIPTIPPNVIEPFISAPLVVEVGALDNAPRIVATQQDRVFLGNGDLAYVNDADPATTRWQVYRNGKPLLDPENPKQVLGYEAFYLGRGDRLVPAIRPPLVDYIPHKPDTNIDGRIISVYGGVGQAGRGSIVSMNRGVGDGIEIGHVLALERNRTIVERDEKDRKVKVTIPAERIGLALVFRTFERISYALVVQSEGTVEVNDFIRTP